MYQNKKSKYSEDFNNKIRYNIVAALDDLAQFNGVDINTMKNSPPYSLELSKVTSQKIASELKKLIDYGMVVKGVVKGKTVKYMLRTTYNDLIEQGKITQQSFGYGDYRDKRKNEEQPKKEEGYVSQRILTLKEKKKYPDMW